MSSSLSDSNPASSPAGLRVDRDNLTLKQAAERVGVSTGTLRRWAETGVIPHVKHARGEWSAVAVSHARLVARMRERGHPLEQIREATKQGRLAYGYIEDLFPDGENRKTLKQVAKETELEPALVERFWAGIGLPPAGIDHMSEDRKSVV